MKGFRLSTLFIHPQSITIHPSSMKCRNRVIHAPLCSLSWWISFTLKSLQNRFKKSLLILLVLLFPILDPQVLDIGHCPMSNTCGQWTMDNGQWGLRMSKRRNIPDESRNPFISMHASQTFHKKIKFLSLFLSVPSVPPLVIYKQEQMKQLSQCGKMHWIYPSKKLRISEGDFPTETFLLRLSHWRCIGSTLSSFSWLSSSSSSLGSKSWDSASRSSPTKPSLSSSIQLWPSVWLSRVILVRTTIEAHFDKKIKKIYFFRDSWTCLAVCHCLVASFGESGWWAHGPTKQFSKNYIWRGVFGRPVHGTAKQFSKNNT